MNSFTALVVTRRIANKTRAIANFVCSIRNFPRPGARRLSFSIAAAPAMAAIFALTGCAVFSSKVDLKKIPVVSIDAAQANGPGIAPGDKSPLIVTVTDAKGKQLKTEGKGKGPVRWRDLAVTSTVASANTKGVLTLSNDPRVSEGQLPHVTIAVPSHPDVKSVQLDVPLRYDRDFKATFRGFSGSSGGDGQDGSDGSNGSLGSISSENPSPGGDGSNGGNGTPGDPGGPGGDGPPVTVLVALHYAPVVVSAPAGAASSNPGALGSMAGPLLQVSVSSGRTQQLFLVDPHGGSLTITSAGGSGGSGGRGGRGGRGGSGGAGTPSGHDGMSGSDGPSGSSGRDGNGGPIFVTYDPRTRPYLGAIQLRNPRGPKPVVKEGAVGPLW
jgi:hypothetical protein